MGSFLYNIGDIVTVHSPGKCYSRWVEMFKYLGFKNVNPTDEINKNHIQNQTWIVFNSIEHSNRRTNIYAIRNINNSDEELLIDETGISCDSSINGIVSQINYELNNS